MFENKTRRDLKIWCREVGMIRRFGEFLEIELRDVEIDALMIDLGVTDEESIEPQFFNGRGVVYKVDGARVFANTGDGWGEELGEQSDFIRVLKNCAKAGCDEDRALTEAECEARILELRRKNERGDPQRGAVAGGEGVQSDEGGGGETSQRGDAIHLDGDHEGFGGVGEFSEELPPQHDPAAGAGGKVVGGPATSEDGGSTNGEESARGEQRSEGSDAFWERQKGF